MEFGPSNLLRVFYVGVLIYGLCAEKLCESPQYLELYSTAIVHCTFQKGFFGVFWYNSSNYRSDYPLITYQESEKEGVGFFSGEFDVHLNGSLIINYVTLQHEHSFAVAYLYAEDGSLEISVIEVVVVVKPLTPFPVINQCGNGSRFCIAASDLSLEIICNVQRSRPPVALQWLVRNALEDQNISSTAWISTSENWFNSYAVMNLSAYITSTLSLFVCKALNSAPILSVDEALLMVQRKTINITATNAITTYFKQYTKLELNCSSKDLYLLVWQRSRQPNESPTDIAIASFIGEQVKKVNSNEYYLGEAGSLMAMNVGLQHEGFYSCWYNDIDHEGVIAHKAILYVDPDPPHLIINGCSFDQECIIQTERKGSLTCSLKGVRPKVRLTWRTLLRHYVTKISFTKVKLEANSDGDTFDVSVTSDFEVEVSSGKNITVVCTVAEPYNELFNFTSEAELRVVLDDSTPANTEDASSIHQYVWVLVVVTLILVFLGFLFCHRKCSKVLTKTRPQSSIKDEPKAEKVPMIERVEPSHRHIEEKTALFIKQLKTKYGVLYNAVQPIPYIKDKLYSVDKVFVEGGIKILISLASQGNTTKKWCKLDCYQNILNHNELKSARLLLEGDPGYGKSTLILQLAYDWCNSLPSLSETEILVLLQLRQLGSVRSIYEAITQFLLPLDSPLNQNDVKDILLHSNSTTILLDGYDEYPGRFDDVKSDIMQIIEYKMFQEVSVVLTTRSSVLPSKYLPNTKRLRLSGFDGKARRYYIKKAVVGEDDAAVDKIEKHLADNPVLGDLCQVPLLFVVFAHMTHEAEEFVKLNSATKYFRYMITTFHSHMRNKMNEADADKYKDFEHKHDQLDRAAFEALTSKRKTIVWKKEELVEKVGQDLYDVYVRIGILVEEEILNIIDHPKTPISTHIQYRTEVRFYHKMFCEWYAAFYVATKGSDPTSNILGDFLRKLDPFEFQYSYRFACGLNNDVARVIIKFLQTFEGGEQFAILCILEHSGRTEDIQENICRICKEGIVISRTDTLLLQRSSLQLLEGASQKKIPIKYVKLHNCITSVDLLSGKIILESGLSFSNNIWTEGIAIDFTDRSMTEETYDGLLQFSSTCPTLKLLSFDHCIPPQTFNNISSLGELQKRNIKVEWQPSRTSPVFLLNLRSGQWEDKLERTVLSTSQYNGLKFEFSEISKSTTDEIDKAQVKHMRAVLRRLSTDD